MLKNYLITAFRNLLRQKTTTGINVAGLSLGVASSLILFLLIRHHSSFDTYHTKRDRIYRVVTQSDGNDNSGKNHTAGVPAVLPEAFKNDFSEAEEVTFTSYRAGGLVVIPQKEGDPKRYQEDRGITYIQPNFYKIFDRQTLIGDFDKGVDEPNEVILSKQAALKYFGRVDAIGEVLVFDEHEFKVTAIVEDYPANTDLPFDVMLSYATIKKELDDHGWQSIWSDEQCYFLLKEGQSTATIESGMPAFVEKYLGKDNWNHRTFLLQSLKSVHFDDRFSNYNYNTVEKEILYALGFIALFLIFTACINFVNLATAEAIKRSKEVGIRKSLGGTRKQLIVQFLGETTIITTLSVLLALALTQFALAALNPFLSLSLSLDFSSDLVLWAFIIGVTLIVSLLSGLYPSFVVSSFKPAYALKNLIGNKTSSGYMLRRSLVVLQFFISQFFIIGTIVLISQMNYFMEKDLGFSKEAIVTFPIPSTGSNSQSTTMRTLRDEVMKMPGVESATLCYTPPSSGSVSGTDFTIQDNETNFITQVKVADANYFRTFGLQMVAGKTLDDLDTANAFVVNERLAKMVGFNNPADIIGKEITMWDRRLPVVGVVRDFHTTSLRDQIEATIMLNRVRNYRNLSVKLNPSSMSATIESIKEKWQASYPDQIFSYEFLDQEIKNFYESENRTSILLSIFTSMAIFIGCLGLFGLATFMSNQKSKEVGIRKVMGASVESIIFLFSKEYIRLVIIGFFLAAPAAWFVMSQALNEFAYKIEIGPTIFLIGFSVSLLIALLTVGYRSLKAATANPVNSLRSE